MTTNPEKIDELRDSANQLAKQALETAELGLRLVREQFDSTMANQDVQDRVQNATFNVEAKAKEMFTLATNFMTEINSKWQPQPPAPGDSPAASQPKAEKIDIDVE